MTYETVAELLAYVQMYSLKSDWSCLVWRPDQSANLSANFSFALIFCWRTLIRRTANARSVPTAVPSILGESRRCKKRSRWQVTTGRPCSRLWKTARGPHRHCSPRCSMLSLHARLLHLGGDEATFLISSWTLLLSELYYDLFFSEEVNLLATLSSGFLQNTSN